MGDNKISTLYYDFINCKENQHELVDVTFDISWLDGKVNYDEMIKLEEIISAYGSQNGKVLFESGFRCAWKLFLEISG